MPELDRTADDVWATVVIRNTEIVVTLLPSGGFAVQWIGEPGNPQSEFPTLSSALELVVALVRADEFLEG